MSKHCLIWGSAQLGKTRVMERVRQRLEANEEATGWLDLAAHEVANATSEEEFYSALCTMLREHTRNMSAPVFEKDPTKRGIELFQAYLHRWGSSKECVLFLDGLDILVRKPLKGISVASLLAALDGVGRQCSRTLVFCVASRLKPRHLIVLTKQESEVGIDFHEFDVPPLGVDEIEALLRSEFPHAAEALLQELLAWCGSYVADAKRLVSTGQSVARAAHSLTDEKGFSEHRVGVVTDKELLRTWRALLRNGAVALDMRERASLALALSDFVRVEKSASNGRYDIVLRNRLAAVQWGWTRLQRCEAELFMKERKGASNQVDRVVLNALDAFVARMDVPLEERFDRMVHGAQELLAVKAEQRERFAMVTRGIALAGLTGTVILGVLLFDAFQQKSKVRAQIEVAHPGALTTPEKTADDPGLKTAQAAASAATQSVEEAKKAVQDKEEAVERAVRDLLNAEQSKKTRKELEANLRNALSQARAAREEAARAARQKVLADSELAATQAKLQSAQQSMATLREAARELQDKLANSAALNEQIQAALKVERVARDAADKKAETLQKELDDQRVKSANCEGERTRLEGELRQCEALKVRDSADTSKTAQMSVSG